MRRFASFFNSAVFAAVVAVAPTEVDAWRLDPAPPPARILSVGDPVTALWAWEGSRA